MAVRATSGPTLSTRSARVGDAITLLAKIENTGAEPVRVAAAIEDVHEGALRKPVEHRLAVEPATAEVPPKSRRAVEFRFTASLPEGKTAFTFRGKVTLRREADGALVGEAPLDLYVSSG